MKNSIETKVIAFLMVLMLPFSYLWIQTAFYLGGYIGLNVVGMSQERVVDVLNSNYFLTDTILCFLMLCFYFPWYWIVEKTNIGKTKQVFYLDSTQPSIRIRDRWIWLKAVVITIGTTGVSNLWMQVVSNFFYEENILGLGESLDSFTETWTMNGQESWVWIYGSVVILGPLIEELVFRGLQFHYAEKIRPGWVTILVTALAFGLWHGEPVQVVYTFIIGIALGIVYHYSKSMLVVTVMHILNNFFSQIFSDLDIPILYLAFDWMGYLMILPAIILLFRMRPRKLLENR